MKLEAIEYEQIRQMMARAAMAIDYGLGDVYATCYTPDGSFEMAGLPEGAVSGAHLGRDGVAEFSAALFGNTQGNCRHVNLNHVFEEETEDEVKILSYLFVIRTGEVPQAGVILTGIYRDTLRKVDGEWLLHRRLFHADPQPEHPTPSTDVLVLARDAAVTR